LLSSLLVGFSIFLTPVIRLVPLPVLLGLFLYMGVVALFGQECTRRAMLLFMPPKYQPDFLFLRLVPLQRVHLFTFIQLLSLALLFAIKSVKQISMFFPVMLVVMVIIRKLMERFFTRTELAALDHELPTWPQLTMTTKQRKENEAKETFHKSSVRRISRLHDELP